MLGPLGRIHPLLLFLCVGVLLFSSEEWRTLRKSEGNHFEISSAKIEQLESTLMQRYGQQPNREQLDAELAAYIDEELLYREALRLELYLNDEVVRRRLAQTMAFIIEGKADAESPSDEELRAWYDRNQAGAKRLTRYSFRHLFFSSDQHKEQARLKASNALAQLKEDSVASANLGDPFLLGQQFRGQTIGKLAGSFGQNFAEGVADLPLGQWSGPVGSNFGYHLILLEDRQQATVQDFTTQRDQLVNAWRIEKRRELREHALDRLRQEFDIVVQDGPAQQVGQL